MSVLNLWKTPLSIRAYCPAGFISRHITNSTVFRSIFYISDANEYEQTVKNSEKPIFVNFYDPNCPKSQLQYSRVQEVMSRKPKFMDLAHIDITNAGVMDQLEEKDSLVMPLLAVCDHGKIVKYLSGSVSKINLTLWLDQAYCDAHSKIKYKF